MADYNRNKDYSHYAGDDNWDKYDERYDAGGNSRQNRGDYNRVNYIPDNDDNRFEPYNRTQDRRAYGGQQGFDDWRGRGNVAYGGGSQNQYHQGNFDYGRPHDNRGREDWGYAYANTGLNDEYNRSYFGHHRRHEDDDLVYQQREEERLRDYDRRERYMADRPGYREGDRALRDNTYNRAGAWARNEDEEHRRRMQEGPYRGRGPKGYSRSVDRIREDVCERLSDDDKLDASNIAVRMEGTEVVLEGTVETKHDKRRAEDLIDSIPGVTNVQNHLVVGTPTTNAVISAVAGRNASTYASQIDADRESRKD